MELLGNAGIIKDMTERAEQALLSHAYLFSGTEGIGKKSLALRLAPLILCDDESCRRQIEKGTFPDFKLVSEESMIKVDQVKEMQQFLSEKPLYSKKKVLVIDNAHLMNPQAQNKLLKTLEEAPAFSHLFLITSQEHSLLDTIRSRCIPVTFAPLSHELIFSLLDPSFSEEERRLAASFSGGSVAKAQAMLADEDYRAMIRLPEKILDDIIQDRYDKLLESIDSIKKEELHPLLDQLALWLRDVSVIKDQPPKEVIYYKGFEEPLKEHAKSFHRETIFKMLQELDETRARFESHLNLHSLLYQLLMGWLEDRS